MVDQRWLECPTVGQAKRVVGNTRGLVRDVLAVDGQHVSHRVRVATPAGPQLYVGLVGVVAGEPVRGCGELV